LPQVGADDEEVEVSGRTVRITHPDKVFFPGGPHTKLDLVRYYLAVEEPALSAMRGRPVLLQRFPDGVGGTSFFQKRIPDSAPAWLRTAVVATPNGTTARALVIDDLAHVVWAVNQGCLGFHVWPSHADDLEHADELRIDLDPQPGVGFEMVREAAHEVRAFLAGCGVAGHPKTTGSRGVHVYVRCVPRWTPTEVRSAAVTVAREVARRRPDLCTSAWWKEERGRRVFLDFNQNAPHKTVFGAWSARARVGAQVSTPVRWDELDSVDPDDLTIATVPERVRSHGDPWAHLDEDPQVIDVLVERFQRDLVAGVLDEPWPPVYPKQPHEPPRVAPSRAKREA
jgi:DNA ligase D